MCADVATPLTVSVAPTNSQRAAQVEDARPIPAVPIHHLGVWGSRQMFGDGGWGEQVLGTVGYSTLGYDVLRVAWESLYKRA